MNPRRQFLSRASLTALATLLPAANTCARTNASTSAPSSTPTQLDLQRNGERFLIDISTSEGYRAAAWVLRDIRAGNITGFPNVEMLYLAAWSQAILSEYFTYTVFEVTSGLRTPQSNKNTEGAALNSRHLPDSQGQFFAMDIKPIGAQLQQVSQVIKHPAFGGVGTYQNHIHFDIRNQAVSW